TDPIADAWTTYSSRRWKQNIQPIQGALDKVKALNGVYFNWKADGKRDIGMIAEEVGAVIPEVVVYEENGIDAKSLDYARLTTVLIEAIKEQGEVHQAQIKALEAKIQALEALSIQELGNSKELISENSAGEISSSARDNQKQGRNDKESMSDRTSESEFSLIKWLELVIRKLFAFLNPSNYLVQK
ncbi:tail fiber domain-containing protein, partial [Patescibacteria group bacterium AH-259-L07]|nr:tail fiber domain-containing protein [Patescibacteria group bacterium AH-259-L07]